MLDVLDAGFRLGRTAGDRPDKRDGRGGGGGNKRDEAFPAVEHERKDSLFLSYAYRVS
jgi:hypothetical protein